MKRVLILHRNCLFRDCLASYLRTVRHDDAVSIDHSQVKDVEEILSKKVDLILLDLNLPGDLAIELVRAVGNRDIKIILLVPDDHQSLFECIAAGVHGCVLERSTLEVLNRAIASVLIGEMYCSSEFAKTIFSELAKFSKGPAWQLPDAEATCRLTARERQVLDLIAKRKCNKEIAKALSVSLFTIKNHVHNILEKLNVKNRVEAVTLAKEAHLLPRL